jgi:Na+-driven multidrug efflux pump
MMTAGLWYLKYRFGKIPSDKPKRFDRQILFKMLRIAVPSILQQSVVSVGMMCVQGLVNGYGTAVTAGYAAATKIDGVVISPMLAIGNSISTFTAQNLGAKKPERVPRGYVAGLCIVVAFWAVIATFIFIFDKTLVGLFMGKEVNEKALQTGVDYLHIVSVFYVLMGIMNATNGVHRGSGHMKTFLLATFTNLISRIVFAVTLSNTLMGEFGIWWSMPISWFIAMCATLPGYFRHYRLRSRPRVHQPRHSDHKNN